MDETSKTKGSVYLTFLASTHFIIHVYTMLLPVLLLPLQEELGVSLVQISLLASVPRLLNVFIYLPIGVISDRHPSQILTLSLVTTAAGAILVPLSQTFPLLLLGFTLLSIGSTLYHPPSLKMASEYDPEKMSLAMGIHNIGSSLGFAAGPLLLGYTINRSDWRNSFYVWAALTCIVIVFSYRYTRVHLVGDKESSIGLSAVRGVRSLMSKGFLMVVAMSTLVEMAFNILVTYVPVYFTIRLGMAYSLTSTITGLGPLTGLVGSVVGGYAGVRFGKFGVGIAFLASIAALQFFFPNIQTFWLVIAVYGITRCLQAAFMPLLNSMIADNSSAQSRSLGYSFNFVVVNLVGSLTTTATSMLIETYDTTVIFPISIATLIPTIALILLLWRQSKK